MPLNQHNKKIKKSIHFWINCEKIFACGGPRTRAFMVASRDTNQ